MKKPWGIAIVVVLLIAAAGVVAWQVSRPPVRQYHMRFVSYTTGPDDVQAALVTDLDDDVTNPAWTKTVRCPVSGLQRGDVVLIQEVRASADDTAGGLSPDTVLSKVE